MQGKELVEVVAVMPVFPGRGCPGKAWLKITPRAEESVGLQRRVRILL